MPDTASDPLIARNAGILATLQGGKARLPSPNAVALQLMRLVERRDVGVFEVCRVAKGDPVLVGKAVQLANSALYAGLRPTAALEDAVMRIGVSGLGRLAVGLSVVQGSAPRLGDLDLQGYWRRALACALALQHLARRRHALAVSEAFSLGLLADIGQLAMLAALGAQALGDAPASAQRLGWQRRRWGFDQSQASAALLYHWNFPRALWTALLPADAEDRPGELAAMVDVARGLAAALDTRRALEEIPALCARALRIGFDDRALRDLAEALQSDVGDLVSVLDMPVSVQLARDELQRLRQSLDVPAEEPGAADTGVLLAGPLAAARPDLQRALRAEGLSLQAEPDLAAAFERARSWLPHAVVLDADELQPAAAEACAQLRERLGARVYLLLLGDQPDADQLPQLLRAGANDVLPAAASAELVAAKLRAGLRMLRLIEALERERAQACGRQRELAALNARLREEAYSDELTGLPNRRALDAFLAHACEHAVASGAPLSCVLLDLDHFKAINDTHGHDVGDEVLRAVARVLQQHSRVDDMLARWGGEELVLVCPGVAAQGAAALAERMRAAVQGLRGELPSLTLSAGVAQASPGQSEAAGALLRAADRALLRAKREGRNRVVVDDHPG